MVCCVLCKICTKVTINCYFCADTNLVTDLINNNCAGPALGYAKGNSEAPAVEEEGISAYVSQWTRYQKIKSKNCK